MVGGGVDVLFEFREWQLVVEEVVEVQGDARVRLVSQVVLKDATQSAAFGGEDVAWRMEKLRFVEGQG